MLTRASRRVRHLGGRLIRRWGLLPAGDPDGLGDDDALRGQSLPFSVLVYFADTLPNLYQLRQWYGPLQALNAEHRVGLICLDSRVAAVLRVECGLPVICCGRVGTLEDLISRSDVALALYVNHNPRNLHPLRFSTMVHAYLGHGESDKASSASNQVKAYDFVLVPGEAGRERLARNLLRYDADRHVRLVGRPQLDGGPIVLPHTVEPGTRPAVLYAPTWEGAQPSMAYSSVCSHGPELLGALLESRHFRVIYRPHPRIGANSAEYARADQRLRALVEQYRGSDPAGEHSVDLTSGWDARRERADLLISDISAVAGDWMSTGKPILVTVPASSEAFLDSDTVLQAVPGIGVDDAARVVDLVEAELADTGLPNGGAGRRRAWVERAMGDTTPGAATALFLSVCKDLIAVRGQELAARAARQSRELGPAR